MVERQLWKWLRRSMSTKQGQLNFHARCSQLSPSCQCSSQKFLSCSRRKRRKIKFWSVVCRTLTKDCLRHQMQMLSGRSDNVTCRGAEQKVMSAFSAKLWSNNLRQTASKPMRCLVQILTCLQIFNCQGLMVCLRHSNQANRERRCGTLPSQK